MSCSRRSKPVLALKGEQPPLQTQISYSIKGSRHRSLHARNPPCHAISTNELLISDHLLQMRFYSDNNKGTFIIDINISPILCREVTCVVLRADRQVSPSPFNRCMNNLTFGDKSFGYYETIGGGCGAGPSWNGTSGVQCHMTNTRITDPEIFEQRYPVHFWNSPLSTLSSRMPWWAVNDCLLLFLAPHRTKYK